jgi:hypothetical protein
MQFRNIKWAALGCAAALACGGSQPAGGGAHAAGSAAGGIGAPGVPWREKSHDQRMDWMGVEVFPKMKSAFVARDPEGHENFQCQTCHGANMEAVKFEMPNALFSLSKERTIEAAREYDAGVTEFMLSVVVPKMAALLDQKPYDPATGQGFGCFGCHPSE